MKLRLLLWKTQDKLKYFVFMLDIKNFRVF